MRRLLASARFRLAALTLLVLLPTLALLLLLAHSAGELAYYRALLGLILGTVAALLASSVAGEYYLLRPLRALRLATERMAAGNLSARTRLGACPTELAKLGACFNQMATSLEARTDQLAQQEQTARTREQQLRRILATFPEAVLITDRDGRYVQVNAAAEALYGLPASVILQCSIDAPAWRRLTLNGDPLPPSALPFYQARTNGVSAENAEYLLERADGQRVVVALNAAALHDADGGFAGVVTAVRDITMRKALEEQLAHQATYDALTGLPNRSLFLRRLGERLSDHARSDDDVTVFFIDVDGFKAVNDSLGHAAGDALLATIAQRLTQCVRPQDTVARFGGDEFLLLVEGINGHAEVEGIASRILKRLALPFQLDGHLLQLSVSIGMARGTPGQSSADDLLRQADTALYQAKEAGKARAVWYSPQMGTHAAERLDLSGDLRSAVGRGELELHYQPEFDLRSGAVVGVEALVRWRHPERGLLLPSSFLSLAEEAGLTGTLTQWVLDRACRQVLVWEALRPDGPLLRVSVNLSLRQFHDAELVRRVAHVLHETGLHPGCLQIELAEDVLLQPSETTERTLGALRQLGVRLALDHFGRGQISLHQVQQVGADLLKLDQVLVQRLPATDAEAILQAIISAAKALGVEVTAQGLETDEQVASTRALGCHFGQGYYLSRPLEAEQIAAFIGPALQRTIGPLG